jgi:hypothetical protein
MSLARLVDQRTGTVARCEWWAAYLDRSVLPGSEHDSLVLVLTDAARDLRDLEDSRHLVADADGIVVGVVVRTDSGHWIGCAGQFIRGPKRNRLDAEEAVREAARSAT